MSQDTPRHPITLKELVYKAPGAEAVDVRADMPFAGANGEPLAMDLYYPITSRPAEGFPAVLLVHGYNDVGALRMLGCRLKDMRSFVDWGRNISASGMAAIVYSNREAVGDLDAVLRHLRAHAHALDIDLTRLGLYAPSGHAPLALSLLTKDAPAAIACAAMLCPYLLDLDGGHDIATAAAQFRFATPCEGKTVDDLASRVPLFIARAGRDEMPGLNMALDRFVSHALARNLPLTLVNHATGPHAFDLSDDSEGSREVVRRVLAFLRFHLR